MTTYSSGQWIRKGLNTRIREAEEAGLIMCSHAGCEATFFLVPAREFPTLCLDHAADVDREAHGWSPENSVD